MSFIRKWVQEVSEGLLLVARGWRLWLAMALLGAALAAVLAWLSPPRWASEGFVALRPVLLHEGYLLATADLGTHYALRLREESRVERVLSSLAIEEAPLEVTTWHQPGVGLVHLRVLHAGSQEAEDIARALLVDFQDELARENRAREETDRLVIELSRSSFAYRADPPLIVATLRGAAAGLVVGLLLLLALGRLRRGRIGQPLEAEQLTGAPTLGAIPRR
jgi:hypothetical protein